MNNQSIQKYIRPMLPQPTSLTPSGALKTKIKCVLFDIYGTLFISGSGDISLAKQDSPTMEDLERLLARYSIRRVPQTLLKEYYEAIEAEHEALRRQGVDFPEVKIDQIWMFVLQNNDRNTVQQFAVEFELIVNPVYPMPNLKKMLSFCQRRGVLMGIISNAQFYTPHLFKWFLHSEPEGVGFNRDLIFYSYCFGVAKPSQLLFEMAVEKLKEKRIQPHSVLYLGNDMLNDIYPAKITGFHTALFAGDKRSLRLRTDDSRCKKLKPDLVITNLIQLGHHIR